MPVTVQDIINILETIAPENLAESWDNVGLTIGSPVDRISSILIGLDPQMELIEQARLCRANLIITHHPIIFRPLHSILTDHPDGRFIASCLSRNISVISCHTNLDSTIDGVNDALARGLGLRDVTPLSPSGASKEMDRYGLGRIGSYPDPISPEAFIGKLKDCCDPPWLLSAGPVPEAVTRVAVCGGSGSEFAITAKDKGADVYVTAEVKHSTARWAEQAGFWIIDAGHFATEQPIVHVLAEKLKTILKEKGEQTAVHTAAQRPPLQLIQAAGL